MHWCIMVQGLDALHWGAASCWAPCSRIASCATPALSPCTPPCTTLALQPTLQPTLQPVLALAMALALVTCLMCNSPRPPLHRGLRARAYTGFTVNASSPAFPTNEDYYSYLGLAMDKVMASPVDCDVPKLGSCFDEVSGSGNLTLLVSRRATCSRRACSH